MTPSLGGLHHVTAITADPQKNIDFYCNVLGLRLVKLTVNFDDPASYHLYYGDNLGHPGTILTFFAWPGAYAGRIGPPQVTTTAFAVPIGTVDYWSDRLAQNQVKTQPSTIRFDEQILTLLDPDGLQLELVATSHLGGTPWDKSPVPEKFAIRGFHGVTLSEEGYENTARLLTGVMGYQQANHEGNRFRYRVGTGGPGGGVAAILDLLCVPGGRHGTMGAGAVHHVAFRTPDDAQQLVWRKRLVEQGLNVTPVIDREYFHSIYYREPGGVLFEIATEPPGFTVDQAPEQLGYKLMLPAWLEAQRERIEAVLPRLRLPAGQG